MIGQAEKVYKDSTKDEKNLLVEMYKSTQDVLSKQAEQQKAIQKCKNKVHFMTEEMETLQRQLPSKPRVIRSNMFLFYQLYQLLRHKQL